MTKVLSSILILNDIEINIVIPGGSIYTLINCCRKCHALVKNITHLAFQLLNHIFNFLNISQCLILFRKHNIFALKRHSFIDLPSVKVFVLGNFLLLTEHITAFYSGSI